MQDRLDSEKPYRPDLYKDRGWGRATAAILTRGRLLDPQLCVAHHLAPFVDLQPDTCAVLFRRIGYWIETEHGEALLDVRLGDDLGDLTIEQVDDFFRRSGWRDDPRQRVGVLILHTLFGIGRHIGQPGGPFGRCHAKGTQLPGLHRRKGRWQGGECDRRVAADRCLDRRPSPCEWYVHQIELEGEAEQFAAQMRRRS